MLACGFDKSDKFDNKVVRLVNVGYFSTNLQGNFLCWGISSNQIDISILPSRCHGLVDEGGAANFH